MAPRNVADIVLQRDGVWICPNAQMRLIARPGHGPEKQRCGSMLGTLAETGTVGDGVWACPNTRMRLIGRLGGETEGKVSTMSSPRNIAREWIGSRAGLPEHSDIVLQI